MKTLNRVELKGAIGQEPSINTVESRRVAQFSLATENNWKNKSGEWQKETDWHSIVAWEGGFGIADFAELHKGTKVHVIGRLRTRKYTDKQGNDRYVTEILTEELDIIQDTPRNQDGNRVTYQQYQTTPKGAANDDF